MVLSPQLTRYSKQSARKNDLTLTLLTDAGNRVAEQFGLVFTLPDDLKELYQGFGLDLERFNGDDAWTLAMPGRFILNNGGTVLSAEVHPDYTRRPEPADIVKALSAG